MADEFFSTVLGLNFDMCMISSPDFAFRKYLTSSVKCW